MSEIKTGLVDDAPIDDMIEVEEMGVETTGQGLQVCWINIDYYIREDILREVHKIEDPAILFRNFRKKHTSELKESVPCNKMGYAQRMLMVYFTCALKYYTVSPSYLFDITKWKTVLNEGITIGQSFHGRNRLQTIFLVAE